MHIDIIFETLLNIQAIISTMPVVKTVATGFLNKQYIYDPRRI